MTVDLMMQLIQTIIPLLLTPVMGLTVWLLKKIFDERCISATGIKLLLKAQLKELHREHMKNGSITSEDIVEFNELYTAYHNLKGNGLGTIWKEDIEKLERLR